MERSGSISWLFDFDLGVSRIRAGAEAAREAGLPDFVINARIDTFLTGFGGPEQCTSEAIRRANAYLKAGARSVFVPGPVDAPTIGALAKAIDGPLNAWGGVGHRLLPLDELRELGVRRVSLGAGPMLATYAFAKRAFQTAAAGRSLEFAGAGQMFGELMTLMQKYRGPSVR